MSKKDMKIPRVGENSILITHKNFKYLFPPSSQTDYHFGNLEGIDCLQGKNRVIVGTSVPPPHVTLFSRY